MKQLSCIVSEYWPGYDFDGKGHQDFQGNCHNVKVKGQKVKLTQRFTGPIAG